MGQWVAAIVAGWAFAVSAQTYPDRTVRIVVPQLPGGSSDVLGRIVAERLTEKWKQAVIVENRTGANGNIGTDYVAKSKPDGYVWLLTYSGSHAINPFLYKNLPYDPERDLAAVGAVATLPFVLVVHPSLAVTDMTSLVKLAKAKPGQLNYGAQTGSLNHLMVEMFKRTTGSDMLHVPYRGAPDSLNDTISGILQLNYASAGSVIGHIRAGKVRAIAVTSARRSPQLKEVPTVAEAGFPELVTDSWWGLFVAAGTPAELVRRINADVNEVLKRPDVVEKFSSFAAEPFITTPAQFAKVAHDDMEKFRVVLQQSGVKAE